MRLRPPLFKFFVMKKFEVIKEYAGIKEGEIVAIQPKNEKYMIERGYVKEIVERETKEVKPAPKTKRSAN